MALEDILGAVTLLILPVCCRWNGAPVGSCRTMDPKHNVGPKEIPHGYTLKTENEGKFHSTDSAIKWLRCDGNDASAVTHGNSERKNLVTVSWTGFTSPKHTPNIFFRATVVQNVTFYWLRIDSEVIALGSASRCGFNMILSFYVACLHTLFR
ncbi:putative ferric-chelate reductase 1 isoform X3 [Ornithodoros turicata]|uniref:putative ferric-chelate reductase 1 isoform X3 n=1 Tax=Ornithodoros turicata TaxID=34597 RepID=UPI003139DEE9